MKDRIDKIISNNLNISRKETKKLISDSSVTVNEKVCLSPEYKIDVDTDIIKVNGKTVDCRKHIYIMLNKPQGVVSASEDPGDTTVIDLVPQSIKRKGLFPAGRLDKDTVGFVLITDDGDFAHRILSPRNHVEKTYIARLKYNLKDEDALKFERGIILADGTKCLSAKVRRLEEEENSVEIKIVEGRYHQVKRMFASLGNEVLFLKRTCIGNLPLDSTLKEGECRVLSSEEVAMLER